MLISIAKRSRENSSTGPVAKRSIMTWPLMSSGSAGSNFALLVRLVEILDEQDLITLLVVKQIIHKFLRHQNAEAARAYALGFALRNVTKRFVRGIGKSAVLEFFKRKTGSRVFHFTKDHVARANVGDLYVLRSVEFAAMLYGV